MNGLRYDFLFREIILPLLPLLATFIFTLQQSFSKRFEFWHRHLCGYLLAQKTTTQMVITNHDDHTNDGGQYFDVYAPYLAQEKNGF